MLTIKRIFWLFVYEQIDQCDMVDIRLRVRLYSRNCSVGPERIEVNTKENG